MYAKESGARDRQPLLSFVQSRIVRFMTVKRDIAPDPGDNGTFRWSLHKRVVFSPESCHSLMKCSTVTTIVRFDEMTTNETPPPVPPTGLHMKRCKFIWRLLLLSNLTLGAFIFAWAARRDSMEINRRKAQKLHRNKAVTEVPHESITSSIDIDYNYDDYFMPIRTPGELRAPIPEEQQREILKWMLEEKRKLKPKDPLEKKQIDEDKAILKQFLHAKSMPKF
ncbi:hypothetical protein RJT34_32985 [Clitoria ternatea]|uniref:Transmembrane protein n=1 Tax=Clitoria ternatea TaxID=43366 RepID=A0AAN9EZA8_CLITE